MYNSKLIQVYLSLSKEDLFHLKKWLALSAQQHPDAVKLLSILLRKKKITPTVVEKERIFKQLYPKQEINIPRLRHVQSFAVQALELFIKQKELFSNQKLTTKTLATSYRVAGLKKYAQQLLDQSKTIILDQEQRNAQYYLDLYEVELEQFEISASDTRPSSTNLQEVINGFSTFFAINLLQHACIAISHQNLYKTNYSLPLIEALLERIKEGAYEDVPAVKMYYYSYLIQTEEESLEAFEQLKFYLLTYKKVLNKREYRAIYTLAINYCIKRQNSGDTSFVQEAFDWYKRGIEQAILLDTKGYLSRFTYLNIITLGLKLQQFEWVAQFILKSTVLLEKRYRVPYYNYNMGKFYFATKDYQQAMPLFVNMNYEDLFMNIDIKVMQLKIFYEEESWDSLEHLLSSFNRFLQRKSIMSYHKENYLNLIRLTRLLIGTYDTKHLRDKIEETHPLTERDWLLAQVRR